MMPRAHQCVCGKWRIWKYRTPNRVARTGTVPGKHTEKQFREEFAILRAGSLQMTAEWGTRRRVVCSRREHGGKGEEERSGYE